MKPSSAVIRVGLILAGCTLMGQTRVDLSSQTKGALPDLGVTRSSNTVLRIGAACTLGKPCAARIGGTTFSYPESASVTIVSGTPTVRIYVSDGSDGSPAGTIKVRNSAATGVTCSNGCTVENNESTFPGTSIPVATWTASADGQWDVNGVDERAFLSSQPAPIAGDGIVITLDTVAVDTSLIPKKFHGAGPPASVAGSSRGDLFADTVNGDSYECFSETSCTAVAAGNWVKLSTGPQPYLTGPWFLYGRASSVVGQNPSLGQGASNGMVLMGRVDTAARQIHQIAFSVTAAAVSNCGNGSNACGLAMAVLDETRSTVVCATEVATGGNATGTKNINTSGSKSIGFTSGTRVSGGACTLPFGNYWWVIGTDSVDLQIAVDSSVNSGSLLGEAVAPDVMLGTVVAALTGSGGTLGFTNLGGALTPALIGLPALAGMF